MKRILALVMVATLSLSTFAFAEVKETAEVATTEEATEEVKNVELNLGEANFYDTNGVIIGTYPTFVKQPNKDGIAEKIYNAISDSYLADVKNGIIREGNVSSKLYGYEVLETATAAKIEITKVIPRTGTNEVEGKLIVLTVYIDKATNKEMKKDEFEALLPEETEEVAEGEVAEEVPAEEVAPAEEVEEAVEEAVLPKTLPLREYVSALGYPIEWDNGKVTLTKGEEVILLQQDSKVYVNAAGEELELDAPVNVEGILYVPVTFFEQVLNAEVSLNEDGVVVVLIKTVEEEVKAN